MIFFFFYGKKSYSIFFEDLELILSQTKAKQFEWISSDHIWDHLKQNLTIIIFHLSRIFHFFMKKVQFEFFWSSEAHTQQHQSKTVILMYQWPLWINLRPSTSTFQKRMRHQNFDIIFFSWQNHFLSYFQDLKLILCQIKSKQCIWYGFNAYASIWWYMTKIWAIHKASDFRCQFFYHFSWITYRFLFV